MTKFTPITQKDIPELVSLAESIWKEHYYTCLDEALVDRVFEDYQSEGAVRRQLEEGSRYFYVTPEDSCEKAGYFSIIPREGKMYISKLYLSKDFRGKGIGKEILTFIKDEAKKEDLHEIFLNVNRANVKSIEAYKRLGFSIVKSVEFYIGGFLCRDHIMELSIN